MPLPELEQIPEDLVVPTGQLEKAANWAGTFGGSGTNLAQRHRHNADIKAYAERQVEERAAAMQFRLEQSKGAQDVFFRSKKLDLDEASAVTTMREREMRMQNAMELHPKTLAAREASTRVAIAREKNIVDGTDLEANLQQQEEDDTSGFQTDLKQALAGGLRRGTPDYANTVSTLAAKYKAVNKDFFGRIWKTTGSTLTAEEAAEQLASAQALVPGAGVRVGPGGVSITAKPTPTMEESLKKDLHYYEGRAQTANNKDESTYVNAQVIRLRKELGMPPAPGEPSPAATSPTPAATSPSNAPLADPTPEQHAALPAGAKFVWKGKEYTKR